MGLLISSLWALESSGHQDKPCQCPGSQRLGPHRPQHPSPRWAGERPSLESSGELAIYYVKGGSSLSWVITSPFFKTVSPQREKGRGASPNYIHRDPQMIVKLGCKKGLGWMTHVLLQRENPGSDVISLYPKPCTGLSATKQRRGPCVETALWKTEAECFYFQPFKTQKKQPPHLLIHFS